jgi:hypothetical protein
MISSPAPGFGIHEAIELDWLWRLDAQRLASDGVGECKFYRAEKQSFAAQRTVWWTVFSITQDGGVLACQVDADLVSAPCMQLYIQQRQGAGFQ